MMQEPSAGQPEPSGQSTTHLVYVLMQFALAVRYRKNVVILALVVCAILGGLYYASATRYYSARASLLVMQSGSAEVMSPSMSPQNRQQGLMPTYESLICSAKVLEGALLLLRPEDRVDLADVPKERWVRVLQTNLSAKTLRSTNIIEIEYRSKDPAAAVAVVNAVVQSYLDFMDKTHKGTANAIISILSKEQNEVAQKLALKISELQAARDEIGGVYPREGSDIVHPVVQRALSLNESLIGAQKDRVGAEASLAVIEAAVRNGDDLQQPILSVANVVGKELMLAALGFSPQDVESQTAVERNLLTDKANLEALQEHLGPNHPQVTALISRVRMAEQYLLGYQEHMRQRMAQVEVTKVGPMLIGMLRQRLNETRQREAALSVSYQQAMVEASALNDRLSQLEILEHDVGWLRELHDVLLKRIADLDLTHEGPDIRTAIISEPEISNVPVCPNLTRVALLVLVAGMGAGLSIVYILDTLDDRFRSIEEMQQQLGAPVLTMVRPLKCRDATGLESLQVYSQPDAPESEAFRTLRTALSLNETPTGRIVITSAEPGDGKTTVLANLAVCFAQADKKTLLIDADMRRPGLTALLGLRGIEGLATVIHAQQSVVELATSYIRASGVEGLDVLPAGARPSDPAELLANPRFSELLSWAETVYDQILIDSPPTLAASDTVVAGRLCDGVILVIQPEKNRRRLVMRAAESLAVLKIPLLGVVINRAGSKSDSSYYGYGGGYDYDYQYGAEERTAGSEDQGPETQGMGVGFPVEPSGSGGDFDEDRPAGTIVPRRVA
jgi:capsular exopolysaccharide synthesis family protein